MKIKISFIKNITKNKFKLNTNDRNINGGI